MTTKTLYQILGIKKNATKESIKKAYHKQSQIHHPDKGGDAETFTKIEKANRVLKDDKKRARYDNGDDVESILNTKDNRSVEIISSIFCAILERIDEGDKGDIVKDIKGVLKRGKEDFEDTIKNLQKKIDKLNLCLPKIKHKNNKDNILVSVIKAKTQQVMNGINQNKEKIEDWDKALKVMEEYSYDFVEHLEIGSFPFGGTATATATSRAQW